MHVIAVDCYIYSAVAFKACDIFFGKPLYECGRLFHRLAEFRAEFLEIGFDAFDEHFIVAADDLEALDVDFGCHDVAYRFKYTALRVVGSGHEHLCQWLAYFHLCLVAQREHKRCELLSGGHPEFEIAVDRRCVDVREIGQMDRCGRSWTSVGKIAVEAVAVERRYGSYKFRQRQQAGVQSLVCSHFVTVASAAPETLAVEAHIPVGEVVADKVVDSAGGTGRLVVFEGFGDSSDEGVEQREYPAVGFGTFGQRHLLHVGGEAVDIGIHCKEVVGVGERREELARYFSHTVGIIFQVVPRR